MISNSLLSIVPDRTNIRLFLHPSKTQLLSGRFSSLSVESGGCSYTLMHLKGLKNYFDIDLHFLYNVYGSSHLNFAIDFRN